MSSSHAALEQQGATPARGFREICASQLLNLFALSYITIYIYCNFITQMIYKKFKKTQPLVLEYKKDIVMNIIRGYVRHVAGRYNVSVPDHEGQIVDVVVVI